MGIELNGVFGKKENMKKQSIHPKARTTPAIRKEIQESAHSISNSELARKYNINRTTVIKWRKRKTVEDVSHAPKKHWKKKLSDSDLQLIVQTRKLTRLAIDDLLEVVNRELSVPIGRSRLGEILKEQGLTEKEKREVKKYAVYEPGFIHVDCTYLPKIEGVKSKAFCAIDTISKGHM
jgi:transposase